MNRHAKRNKYRKELLNRNIEISTLKNEIYDLFKNYQDTLHEFHKCSATLEKQEEKTKEYKKKYFEQLKKEFLEGNKELITLSLAVPKDLEFYSRTPTEQLEKERKKHLCYELARGLYDNFDVLRKTEYETSTRFDLVLVKWNQTDKNKIEDWDEFCTYADINPHINDKYNCERNFV